jgi:hypothetical protein
MPATGHIGVILATGCAASSAIADEGWATGSERVPNGGIWSTPILRDQRSPRRTVVQETTSSAAAGFSAFELFARQGALGLTDGDSRSRLSDK